MSKQVKVFMLLGARVDIFRNHEYMHDIMCICMIIFTCICTCMCMWMRMCICQALSAKRVKKQRSPSYNKYTWQLDLGLQSHSHLKEPEFSEKWLILTGAGWACNTLLCQKVRKCSKKKMIRHLIKRQEA